MMMTYKSDLPVPASFSDPWPIFRVTDESQVKTVVLNESDEHYFAFLVNLKLNMSRRSVPFWLKPICLVHPCTSYLWKEFSLIITGFVLQVEEVHFFSKHTDWVILRCCVYWRCCRNVCRLWSLRVLYIWAMVVPNKIITYRACL